MIWWRKIPSRLTPNHFILDVRAEIGVNPTRGHQIHSSAEEVFQVLDKIHEIAECSVSLGEFNKNINITRIRLLTPGNRAKDTNLLHTKFTPDPRQLLLQSPYIV